eukprot:6990840-Prymnesium_polylepis.1
MGHRPSCVPVVSINFRKKILSAVGQYAVKKVKRGNTLGRSHWAVTPNVVRDASGRAQRPLGVPLSRIELH